MTIDQLIAHCERRKAQCERMSERYFDDSNTDQMSFYDGKSLVYDEMIDKLKLLKEFGQ